MGIKLPHCIQWNQKNTRMRRKLQSNRDDPLILRFCVAQTRSSLKNIWMMDHRLIICVPKEDDEDF
jgi:hypothetical protein